MNKDLHLDKETNELKTTKDTIDGDLAPLGVLCFAYIFGSLFVMNMCFEWIPFELSVSLGIVGFFCSGGMTLVFEPMAKAFKRIFK